MQRIEVGAVEPRAPRSKGFGSALRRSSSASITCRRAERLGFTEDDGIRKRMRESATGVERIINDDMGWLPKTDAQKLLVSLVVMRRHESDYRLTRTQSRQHLVPMQLRRSARRTQCSSKCPRPSQRRRRRGVREASTPRPASTPPRTTSLRRRARSRSWPPRSARSQPGRNSTDSPDARIGGAAHRQTMTDLGNAATRIGEVIGLIQAIAGADQPAGAQRHHRGGARRRGRPRLRGGRRRGEVARRADRQGDRGDRRADRRDPVRRRRRGAGDRAGQRHHRRHVGDRVDCFVTVEEQNAAISSIAEGVNRASLEAQGGAEAMSRVAGTRPTPAPPRATSRRSPTRSPSRPRTSKPRCSASSPTCRRRSDPRSFQS